MGSSPLVSKEPELMAWGQACEAMVEHKRVKRASWPGEDQVLLHAGAVHLRKGSDYTMHTLIVSEGDLTATDWIVVREQ